MKNESLYQKTVDILVQSYFNDTLNHGSCTACAVGNIVAANNGYSHLDIRTWGKDGERLPYPGLTGGVPVGWGATVCTEILKEQERRPQYLIGEPLRQIESTGYEYDDICKIEKAFERGRYTEGDIMFNSLMAVIETLDEIHENNDTQVTEASKRKFQKQI